MNVENIIHKTFEEISYFEPKFCGKYKYYNKGIVSFEVVLNTMAYNIIFRTTSDIVLNKILFDLNTYFPYTVYSQ